MENPAKSLGYIECYSSSGPRHVKSPSNSIRYKILSDIVRKSVFDWEDLKPYWKSEKATYL